jgi:hypothetical protein
MHRRAVFAVFVLSTSAALLLAQQPQQAAQQPQSQHQMPMGGMGRQPVSKLTTQVSGPLTITFGDKSAEWTPEKLAALPHTTLTVWNEHAKANQTYSGVPLIDLLTQIGVPAKPRGNDLRLYLVAEGSDGYKVVYSIGEITPDVHDATVMVADRLAGEPIKDSGPLQLVATGEKRPARWVRNLVAIRVFTAQ